MNPPSFFVVPRRGERGVAQAPAVDADTRRRGGWVALDGERYEVKAKVHTLGGYSAHVDQKDLLNFIGRMQRKPRQVRLVHGDEGAKAALARLLRQQHAGVEVVVP